MYFTEKSCAFNLEDHCSCGGIRPSWTMTGLVTAFILICLMICRSKFNCGKILAMKLWQALTGLERGCSFFQVHLLEAAVITDSLLDCSRLFGSLHELTLNPVQVTVTFSSCLLLSILNIEMLDTLSSSKLRNAFFSL